MPQSILSRWIDAVNDGRLEDVLALYERSATLIPTFSSHTFETPDQVRKYFEALCSRPGLGVALHEKTVRVQPLGGTAAAISGIYCFRFSIDDEPLSFEARFTMVVDPAQLAPIIHHHSSQVPRTLT